MPFEKIHLEELADACRRAAAGTFVPTTDQVCCGVPIVAMSVTRDLARFAEMWTMPEEASREVKVLYAEALHAFDVPLLDALRAACDKELETGYTAALVEEAERMPVLDDLKHETALVSTTGGDVHLLDETLERWVLAEHGRRRAAEYAISFDAFTQVTASREKVWLISASGRGMER